MANHQYNTAQYNATTYNADGQSIIHLLICSGYNSFQYNAGSYNCQIPHDLVTLLDATVLKTIGINLTDFIIIDENLTKQITAKVLTDTARLADWLTAKQNPQTIEWGDD